MSMLDRQASGGGHSERAVKIPQPPCAPLPSWPMPRAERTPGPCLLEVVEEAKSSL